MRQPPRPSALRHNALLQHAVCLTRTFTLLWLAGFLFCMTSTVQAQAIESPLWQTDAQGNVSWDPRLNDFTNVGYMNGNAPIPTEADYPNAVDVTDPQFGAIPDDGIDDSQAFIDALAACPPHSAVFIPKGRYVMKQRIIMDRDHIVLRGEDMLETILFYPNNTEEIYLQEVGFQNPDYYSPGNGHRNTGGLPFFVIPGGTHRSMENLSIVFRDQIKRGHWEHKGNDAIKHSGTHSWIQNLYIKNADHGISTSGAQFITVQNIVFDQFIDRQKIKIEMEGSKVGHMAMQLNDTDDNLFHNIVITGDWSHEFDMKRTQGVVISDVQAKSKVVAYHGQGVKENLYTNLAVEDDTASNVGGDNPHNETYWGVYSINGFLGNGDVDYAYNLDAEDHIYVGYGVDPTLYPTKSDADFWFETIDPAQLSPLNLYKAQLAERGKPVPATPALPLPDPYTGDVIRIKAVENNTVSESSPDNTADPLAFTFSLNDNTYFKFDLNELNLTSIDRVRLRLSVQQLQNLPVELGLYSVEDDAWAADTLTYNNKKPPVELLDTFAFTQGKGEGFMEFDVTAFVQDQWANDPEKIVSLNLNRISGDGNQSILNTLHNGFGPILIIEQVADPVPGDPSAPTEVSAESLIGNIRLDWPDNPENDVVTYNVYRSTTSGEFSDYGFPIGMGLTSSEFVDMSSLHDQGWDVGMMNDSVAYFYRVTAVDAHGNESEASLEIVAAAKPWDDSSQPPSFTNSMVILDAANQYIPYTASLTGTATDPEGDPLYFSRVNGPDWITVTPDGTITATPREGDTGTFPFTVQVAALHGGQDEATVYLTVNPAVPDAPQWVDLLQGDSSVQLDWDHDAEGSTNFTFNVYRSEDGGPYEQIASNLLVSDYVDSGLNNGITYSYVLTASNDIGESPLTSVTSATPVPGLSIATNYIGGGLITDPASWDNGLPVGQWGRIDRNASLDTDVPLDGYSVLHTSGTLSPTGISGLQLTNGSQWIMEGDTAVTPPSFRGFIVSGGSTATIYNGTVESTSGKDWSISGATSSLAIHGGTVTVGRSVKILGDAGPDFSIGGGTLISTSGYFGGNQLSNSAKTMHFNGGTSSLNNLELSGDNTILHLGGDTAGSLTVSSITGYGSNSAINFLPGTRISMSVSGSSAWAETAWNSGNLTYNGQGNATLGSWASVTSANGLEPGVRFVYDGVSNTLSLDQSVAPNQAPMFTSNPVERFNASEAVAYNDSIAADATDLDNDSLTFSRLSGPAWLSVASNGDLSGTPSSSDAGLNRFLVQVSDGNGGSATATLDVTVANMNDAPVFPESLFSGAPATEDLAYSSSIYGSATDEDGDLLSYTKVSGPAWLTVDPLGLLSGTPTNEDADLNEFIIQADDGNGGTATATLQIQVANVNDTPVFVTNPVQGAAATEEVAYAGSLAGTAVDDDGDTLTYSLVETGSWLNVAPNGALSGIPQNSDVGLNSFTVQVDDGNGGSANTTLTIKVVNVNDAPVFNPDSIIGANATANRIYSSSLAGAAEDVDGDILLYRKVSGPEWLSVASNGDLYGTPDNGDLGLHTFTIGVSDAYGGSDSAELQITVVAGSAPSVFTNADSANNLISNPGNWSNGLPTGGMLGTIGINAQHDSNFTHQGYHVVHTDGRITKTGLSGLNLSAGSIWEMNGATAELSLTRGLNLNGSTFLMNEGTADLTENSRDTSLNSGGELIMNGGVMNVGRSLIFNGGDLTITGGTLEIPADMGSRNFNPGGDAHLDGGAITANHLTFGNDDFQVNLGGNTAGTLAISNFGGSRADVNLIDINVEPGTLMTMQLTSPVESGASGDGDLGWSKVGAETGLSWAEALWADGRLTYNELDFSSLGDWATVTTEGLGDGYAFSYDSGTATLSLIYAPTNQAPVFTETSFSAAAATEDAAYTDSIASSATDADAGDSLIYSLVDAGTWLSVAPNGDLSGTPTNDDVGTNTFTVQVSDGNGGSASATLNIEVLNTNDAPVFSPASISGADATEDVAYTGSIAGSAGDVDAEDTLTYSLVDTGTWLSVAANGDLSGTPTNDDVGTNTFTLQVDDGNSGTDTATLTINVINTNDAPIFSPATIVADNATQDAAYTGSIADSATDADAGDTLTYSLVDTGTWLRVAADGELSGTPTAGDLGLNTFTVQVVDGNGGSATAELQITVDATTPPPTGVVSVGSYTFNGRSLASFDSDSDSVAGDMAVGAGVTTFYWETRDFWSPTKPSAGFNAGTDFSDGTVLDDDYFSFTLTAQAGKTLVLTSLSFIDKSGGFSVSVASDQDGFTSVIDSTVASGGWSATTLDLSSLSPTAGAVELRLYFHDGAGSNRMIDNVDIQATYASVTVPEILTEAAGNITTDSAEVGFTLQDEGGEVPAVFLFYGETDGGTTPANWANSQNLGGLSAGSYAITLNGLSEGTTYYYSVQAFNSAGLDWGTTQSFATDVDTSPKLVRSLVGGVTDTWQTFDLGRSYTSAVIVATPVLPDSNHPPVVTRIRNVSGSTFDLKVERVDGLTGAVTMDVSVIAVEEGVYTQAVDGVTLEAVKMTSTSTARKNSWVAESRTYENTYTTPVVLGQVMSANDPLWSAFWCQGSSRTSPPDASNLRVGKHVGEDPVTNRTDETLGYIVIEAGNGVVNGVVYSAGLGGDIVQGTDNTTSGYTYSLSGLTSASAAAVTLAGMDGGDGGFASLYGATPFTASSLTLVTDEDTLKDSERAHTTEQAGYLVFE